MRNVNTAFILGTFMFRSNITFSTLIQTNCQFEISQHSSRPGDKADKTKKAPTARLQENNYKKVPHYSISLYIQSKISSPFLIIYKRDFDEVDLTMKLSILIQPKFYTTFARFFLIDFETRHM